MRSTFKLQKLVDQLVNRGKLTSCQGDKLIKTIFRSSVVLDCWNDPDWDESVFITFSTIYSAVLELCHEFKWRYYIWSTPDDNIGSVVVLHLFMD